MTVDEDLLDAADLLPVELVHPGDTVILIAYGQMDTDEARKLQPRVVYVDAGNKILATGDDPAEGFGDPRLTRGDVVTRPGH